MSNKANYEKTFWKKIFSSPVYLIDKNLCEEVTEVLTIYVYNKCLKKFIKLVLNKMYISNFVCSSKLYNCDLIIQNK